MKNDKKPENMTTRQTANEKYDLERCRTCGARWEPWSETDPVTGKVTHHPGHTTDPQSTCARYRPKSGTPVDLVPEKIDDAAKARGELQGMKTSEWVPVNGHARPGEALP